MTETVLVRIMVWNKNTVHRGAGDAMTRTSLNGLCYVFDRFNQALSPSLWNVASTNQLQHQVLQSSGCGTLVKIRVSGCHVWEQNHCPGLFGITSIQPHLLLLSHVDIKPVPWENTIHTRASNNFLIVRDCGPHTFIFCIHVHNAIN